MQTTPPDIRDSKLLRLLGEILRSDVDGSNTSGLRLQLMGSGFSWQALVDLALGQGVLLPLIFALTARMLSPPYRDPSKTTAMSLCVWKESTRFILNTGSGRKNSLRSFFWFLSAHRSRR